MSAPVAHDRYALISENLDELYTVAELAKILGCAESTIRNWASRGKITASGLDADGKTKLYKLINALKVESETRHNALGRRAS